MACTASLRSRVLPVVPTAITGFPNSRSSAGAETWPSPAPSERNSLHRALADLLLTQMASSDDATLFEQTLDAKVLKLPPATASTIIGLLAADAVRAGTIRAPPSCEPVPPAVDSNAVRTLVRKAEALLPQLSFASCCNLLRTLLQSAGESSASGSAAAFWLHILSAAEGVPVQELLSLLDCAALVGQDGIDFCGEALQLIRRRIIETESRGFADAILRARVIARLTARPETQAGFLAAALSRAGDLETACETFLGCRKFCDASAYETWGRYMMLSGTSSLTPCRALFRLLLIKDLMLQRQHLQARVWARINVAELFCRTGVGDGGQLYGGRTPMDGTTPTCSVPGTKSLGLCVLYVTSFHEQFFVALSALEPSIPVFERFAPASKPAFAVSSDGPFDVDFFADAREQLCRFLNAVVDLPRELDLLEISRALNRAWVRLPNHLVHRLVADTSSSALLERRVDHADHSSGETPGRAKEGISRRATIAHTWAVQSLHCVNESHFAIMERLFAIQQVPLVSDGGPAAALVVPRPTTVFDLVCFSTTDMALFCWAYGALAAAAGPAWTWGVEHLPAMVAAARRIWQSSTASRIDRRMAYFGALPFDTDLQPVRFGDDEESPPTPRSFEEAHTNPAQAPAEAAVQERLQHSAGRTITGDNVFLVRDDVDAVFTDAAQTAQTPQAPASLHVAGVPADLDVGVLPTPTHLQAEVGAELRRQIPHLTVSKEFRVPGTLFSLDLFVPDYQLGIEVDGPCHFLLDVDEKTGGGGSVRNGKTLFKRLTLERLGYRILSLGYLDVARGRHGDLLRAELERRKAEISKTIGEIGRGSSRSNLDQTEW